VPPLYAVAPNAATATSTTLTAALLTAKTEVVAAQERVRAAALAWERERNAADDLARQVATTSPSHRTSPSTPTSWLSAGVEAPYAPPAAVENPHPRVGTYATFLRGTMLASDAASRDLPQPFALPPPPLLVVLSSALLPHLLPPALYLHHCLLYPRSHDSFP
jgi:hypothetical protein